MSYAVARMEKMKSHDLKGMQFHNQRERESKTNPDIDKKRSHLNYDLIHDKKIDYNERVKEIIESQKTGTRKIRKDAVLVNEWIITSDRKFFEDLTPQQEKIFFEESVAFFQERYGKQNIAYATVHKDEKTPHLHLGVVPMRDGKLQGKNVFNRQELLWLQDKFPEHMQKVGFVIERGEEGSDREHIEMNRYKKQTLEKEIEEIEKSLVEKRSELAAFEKKVPIEVKVRRKREMREIEVPSKEKGLFGLSKTEIKKEPTGNIIVPESDFKKLVAATKENQALKGMVKNLLETDLVKANQDLAKQNEFIFSDWKKEKELNEKLESENEQLKLDNGRLKRHISILRDEITSVYKTTKSFLKEHTGDSRAFKGLFKSLIDRVKGKVVNGEFGRVHKQEVRKEKNRGMER